MYFYLDKQKISRLEPKNSRFVELGNIEEIKDEI